jgi:hypothetical protein
MKSKLQKKMIEDLQLRGYAERTQKSYARSVRMLALQQRGKIISGVNSEAVHLSYREHLLLHCSLFFT